MLACVYLFVRLSVRSRVRLVACLCVTLGVAFFGRVCVCTFWRVFMRVCARLSCCVSVRLLVRLRV